MTSPPARLFIIAVAVASAACGDAGASGGASAAGLETAFDSTADSIFARVEGDVPAPALRRLVAEVRIAPTLDDTSLFSDVFEFEVDAANRFWVYDRPANRVFLFGADGALIRRIGRQGAGPGEFAQGNGMIALPDTGIAVWDSRNARISFFDAAGDFRASWITPSGFSTSNGLYTDRARAFYLKRPVTPPREHEILGRMGLVRLRDDGSLGDSLVPPDIPVKLETYLAVSKDGNGRSSTSTAFAPRFFWDWHPDGYFIAAHGGHYEIVVGRKAGKAITIRRTLPPVSVLDEERSDEQERITWNMRQTDPGWTWSGAPVPQAKAPLTALFVSRDGRIWAQVATPSERIPDEELEPRREKGPPVRRFRAPTVYEVFADDGRFLGRIPFPARTTLVQADGDYVWAITRDEDDLPAVVRYRVEPGLR